MAKELQKDKVAKDKMKAKLDSKGKEPTATNATEEPEDEARGQNDEPLDQLWEKIRTFLSDVTTIK